MFPSQYQDSALAEIAHHHHNYNNNYYLNLNNSLDQEIQLMNDQFFIFGSQLLNSLQFLAKWIFPVFFLLSQCVPASFWSWLNDCVVEATDYVLLSLPTPITKTLSLHLAAVSSSCSSSLLLEDKISTPSSSSCSASASSPTFTSSKTQEEKQQSNVQKRNNAKKEKKREKANNNKTFMEEEEQEIEEGTIKKNKSNNNMMPKHIAVIMDGNRRYGKTKLGSSLLGHRAGGEKLREFVKWCRGYGIEMLTVYAFSTENWNRPQQEIDVLMDLFASFFEQMLLDAEEIGIRIRFISSEPEKLPSSILDLMRRVETHTRRFVEDAIVVNVCVSYGSRSAVQKALASSPSSSSQTSVHSCCSPTCASSSSSSSSPQKQQQEQEQEQKERDNENWLIRKLAASYVEQQFENGKLFRERDADLWGAPELLIRTSGEMRLSNFMLLELAYSEFEFLECTWPEVTEEMLTKCLKEYCVGRQRRMGK